uniref:Uncharacterized protein n=1 Tax=Neobacillus citreus TaxID=2833578 RepID=A0A942T928_9BACI
MLRPVTGSVQELSTARPLETLVATLDRLVGGVPIVGPVVGDESLGAVTAPVTGLVDDVLGGVGNTVGTIPDVVTGVPPVVDGVLPHVPLPGGTLPDGVLPGGTDGLPGTLPVGTQLPATATVSVAGVLSREDRAASVTGPAVTAAGTPAADGVRVIGPLAPNTLGDTSVDAAGVLFGGDALLVPGNRDVQHGPLGDQPEGTVGGGSAAGAQSVTAVGTVGSDDLRFLLAAGTSGNRADDTLPASVVGEHDVAPD